MSGHNQQPVMHQGRRSHHGFDLDPQAFAASELNKSVTEYHQEQVPRWQPYGGGILLGFYLAFLASIFQPDLYWDDDPIVAGVLHPHSHPQRGLIQPAGFDQQWGSYTTM